MSERKFVVYYDVKKVILYLVLPIVVLFLLLVFYDLRMEKIFSLDNLLKFDMFRPFGPISLLIGVVFILWTTIEILSVFATKWRFIWISGNKLHIRWRISVDLSEVLWEKTLVENDTYSDTIVFLLKNGKTVRARLNLSRDSGRSILEKVDVLRPRLQ